MKLSIITVNLNNRGGLKRTIDSVISQTFRDFEWIVIDGGSTDGSKDLIEQYSDHFAYWVSEPDTGIYNAMNKGIRHAKGEYLQFLNSGDILYDKDTLRQLVNNGLDADIVFGDCLVRNSNGGEELITYSNPLPLHLLVDGSICHPSTAINQMILKEEPYDESLKIVSDWKFFLRKALEGKTFRHVNLTITIFDGSGISSTNTNLLMEERCKVIKEEVPPCIITDNQIIHKQQEQLNNWQVRDVIQYAQKRPLYHKIISLALSIIKFIDCKKTAKT